MPHDQRLEEKVYSVQALERALTIVEAVAKGPKRLTEIATDLELNRTTTFRLLESLKRRGYVRRDKSGVYRLGFKVIELALRELNDEDIHVRARPVLRELADKSLESAHLSVRDGLEYVCIDRADTPRPVKLSIEIGRRMPLYGGAMGKLLLAFAPQSVIEEVLAQPRLRLTPQTIVAAAQLRAELERIRKQGYSYSNSEVDASAQALAAPVRDRKGDAIAAVAIVAPAQRIAEGNFAHLCWLVIGAGLTISRELGFAAKSESPEAESLMS